MDVVMRMPDWATVDDTVTLLRWLVEVGQSVRRGDPLLEVETDKAILVVESAVSGILRATSAEAGTEVATGQPIASFDVEETVAAGSAVGPGAGPAPPSDDLGGPIAGAAGVAAGVSVPGTAERSVRGDDGARRSFFARNREARAQVAPASA